MNFFGHAVIASEGDPTSGHVLGAMLPDFLAMTGVRLSTVHDEAIERGIALHHRTDDVFHRSPTFVRHCAEATLELSERGVRRGTARAVAHIGTELLLDGWLLDHERGRKAYQRSLEDAGPGGLQSALAFRERGALARFEQLRARLSAWGVPTDYRDPAKVALRLERALRNRPRLAIRTEDADAVLRFLGSHRGRVLSSAEEQMREVRSGLAAIEGKGSGT